MVKGKPKAPQTLRFQQLIELGKSLEKQLVPLGIVRADWQSQAGILAGTGTGKTTKAFKDSSIWAGLTTWQTIMPRQAQDDIATIFELVLHLDSTFQLSMRFVKNREHLSKIAIVN